MADSAERLSSSQRGTIAEYFVATALMAASGGRLSPFVPLVDDHGVDLLVLDKETGRSVAVQVKSWVGGEASRSQTVQFDVRKATYRESREVALLALILDPSNLEMEASWLIPMSDVPDVSTEQAEKYALRPSRSPESRDRYVPYRHTEVASLAQALSRMFERASAA